MQASKFKKALTSIVVAAAVAAPAAVVAPSAAHGLANDGGGPTVTIDELTDQGYVCHRIGPDNPYYMCTKDGVIYTCLPGDGGCHRQARRKPTQPKGSQLSGVDTIRAY